MVQALYDNMDSLPMAEKVVSNKSCNGYDSVSVACTNLPDYTNLTAENFIINVTNVGFLSGSGNGNSRNTSKSYNAQTGTLSVICGAGSHSNWHAYTTFDVWVIRGI